MSLMKRCEHCGNGWVRKGRPYRQQSSEDIDEQLKANALELQKLLKERMSEKEDATRKCNRLRQIQRAAILGEGE